MHQNKLTLNEQELLYTRTIKVWGAIDSQLTAKVLTEFNILLVESRTKPIILDIDSPGGNVTADENIMCGDNILKMIDNSPVPVYCIIRRAISMAYLIAAHCAKGHRYVIDFYGQQLNMHHQVSGGVSGKYFDIASDFKRMSFLHEVHLKILGDDTGNTPESIAELYQTKGDIWQSADEMIAYGAADKIYTKDVNLFESLEENKGRISLA